MIPAPSIRRNRQAFATATALVMLALLGTVSVAVIADLRAQSRRTLRDQEDAQLHQLLHAGGAIASDLPKVWSTTGPQPQTLQPPVPPETGGTIQLFVRPGPDGATAEARVQATLGDRSATELIRFTRSDGKWAVTSLESE